jgi:hypothetical protein
MVCVQQSSLINTQLSSHYQRVSDTGEGMSHPRGYCNAISCPPHIEIQDHARSDIMISRLDHDFNFAASSENERKDCIITSPGRDNDAGSWNVEFKDESDEYNSESGCSIDIDILYLLGAIDKEQEQGFLLPSWQPELGNESLLLGNTVDECFWSETEATELLELCTSDCWFGREVGTIDAFTDEDWLAESLNGDFLIDCCDDEMEIPG